jgi:carbamoylphosphate synthase large subunit
MVAGDWVGSGKPDLEKTQPLVLIVAAKWWALSARMAAALLRHGCTVQAVCSAEHPLTHLPGVGHIYRYGGVSPMSTVQRALRECRPDWLIPCDDGAVALLHALHALDPSLRSLIEKSLGRPESFPVTENRYQFLRTATDLGIRVPRTRKIVGPEDLVKWHEDVASSAVLKVDGESGGNGVRISHSLDESLAAYQELRKPHSFATACKRLVIDCDPLALWMRRRHKVREVTVQEFIPGRPANSMLVCRSGELLSIVSVAVVAAEGATGAATIVRVIQNERMKRAAELVVSRLKLSGFYGLDFIMEARTGVPYLIEMNPRCTQLGHIEIAGQGSLAGVLSAVLRGEPRPRVQNLIIGNMIALFPQVLAAGEACRAYVDTSYLDVPFDDPELVRELTLESWPQRQWLARCYHYFSPPRRAIPILFEELGTEIDTEADTDNAESDQVARAR